MIVPLGFSRPRRREWIETRLLTSQPPASTVSPVLDGGSGLKLQQLQSICRRSGVSPVLDGGSGLKRVVDVLIGD